MKRTFIAFGMWVSGFLLGPTEAWADPWETSVAAEYLPSNPSIGSPPRPGDTGSEPPRYGEDRNGSLAQDLAAAAGVVGGTIIPVTMVMVKWNETYNERSLYLDPSDRAVAADLLQTYGRTSAIVTPLTSWAGFMIGGGYRQNSVRALLCGVGAAALSYPIGSYLGRKVADPVTNLEAGAQPRSTDRTVFLGALVWTGIVTSGTVAGVVVGGGPVVRPTRDKGYTLNWVQNGDQRVLVHGFTGRF